MHGRVAWERFQLGDELIGVRSEILTSWRRSRLSGVDPSVPVRSHSDADFDSRFARSAIPVVRTTAEMLGTTNTCLAITDSAGVVLWRWASESALNSALEGSGLVVGSTFSEEFAGTNGLGTALETGGVAAIRAEEHFKQHFHRFACVAAPVVHPLTRRTVGAVNITCPSEDANQMLEPTVLKLVHEIRQSLLDAASTRERKLFDEFLAERARSAQPVITLSSDVIISTGPASDLQLEHQRLWSQVLDAVETGSPIELPDGRMAAPRALTDDDRLTGAVLVLTEPVASRPSPVSPAASRPDPAQQRLDDARQALSEGRNVVVRGERGAGKSFFADALCEGLSRVRRLGPHALQADASDVLDALGAERHDLVVVEDLDRVPEDVLLDEVISRLRAVAELAPVAVTWTAADTDQPGVVLSLNQDLRPRMVDLPALRMRRSELHDLAARFLGRSAWVTAPAMTILREHTWPENLTELKFVLTSALGESEGRRIESAHLPRYLWHQTSQRRLTPLERAEAAVIAEAILANGGNKSAAAKELGVSRPTLYSKMRSYRLQ